MKRAGIVASLFLVFAWAVGARADDPWEVAQTTNDDAFLTMNQLVHGRPQTHDLQGVSSGATATDQDWSVVATSPQHSYEVRAFGTNICWLSGNCSRLDRVDSTGAVVQPSGGPDLPLPSGTPGNVALRWIATASQTELIRVRGPINGEVTTAQSVYDIEMLDTTVFLPRWNQSASQTTVLIIQNTSSTSVQGQVDFYDATGAPAGNALLNVPLKGVQLINCASVFGLPGKSGSATLSHFGGYGDLTGKAVTLEPATGFTFDTAFTLLPR